MDAFELQPIEAVKAGEGTKVIQTQELDEATYEPESRIEQTGDYKQSEAIQAEFTAVVNNTAAAADENFDAVSKGGAHETPPVEIRSSGGRDTERGNQPQPVGAQMEYDGLAPMPPDHQASAPEPVVAGAEERNTVLGRQPKAAEEVQSAPDVAGTGERNTVLGREPKAAGGFIGERIDERDGFGPFPNKKKNNESEDYSNKSSMPSSLKGEENDSGRHIRPILQGSEERNTVLGRQPQVAHEAMESEGRRPDDQSNPSISPLGSVDEGVPGKGQITKNKVEGSGVKIDPITGSKSGSLDGTGPGTETESHTNKSATMQDSGKGLGLDRDTDPLSDVPPPQARSKDQDKASHMPIGPGISDEPPTMQKQGSGIGAGSKVPVGQQELENNHFADQALNAIGIGTQGAFGLKSGGKNNNKSATRGYGSKVPESGMPKGPDMHKEGFDNKFVHDSHSSGSGVPVHGYGPGSVGKGEKGGGDKVHFAITSPSGETSFSKTTTTGGTCEGTAVGITEKVTVEGQGGVSTGTAVVECKVKEKGSYMIEWTKTGASMWKVSNTIDGGSPMPYTGVWSDGAYKPKDPGTIGGRDKESDNAKIMPVIRNSGLGAQGGGGSNSTEGPSIWDDGHFYGGIFSDGGDGPGAMDPGGLDYDSINKSGSLSARGAISKFNKGMKPEGTR